MSAMRREPNRTARAAQSRSNANKYLTFSLGTESYAIQILKVREIIRIPDITPVPQMPDYVKGVINLRGKVIPVIDLRVKFRLPKAEFHERTCMVVVCVKLPNGDAASVGLVVDVVEEVTSISGEETEPTPSFGVKVDTEFIMGMAKVGDRVKAVLDIDRVVSSATLANVSEMAEASHYQDKSASNDRIQNKPIPQSL